MDISQRTVMRDSPSHLKPVGVKSCRSTILLEFSDSVAGMPCGAALAALDSLACGQAGSTC